MGNRLLRGSDRAVTSTSYRFFVLFLEDFLVLLLLDADFFFAFAICITPFPIW